MSVLDDILARVGIGGSPPAGMLDLKPQMETEIDPATGARVPKGTVINPMTGMPERVSAAAPVFKKPTTDEGYVPQTPSQVAAALPKMSASAGIAAPNAPFSAGDGASVPFAPPAHPMMNASGPQSGVPMPQPRPDAADAPPAAAPLALAPPDPGDSQLPSKSAPAQAEAPSAEPSILDKLLTGLGNNSSTLVALGAGLAGAPNAGQGISRALTAALPAQQADLKRQLLLGGQSASFKALVDAGVPRQQAMAALQNPKLMEALTNRYMVDPKLETKTLKDAAGVDHVVSIDNYTGKIMARDGVPVGEGGAQSAGADTSGIYAHGVTQENPELKGDDYLAQFSPDVQAAAKAYANGDVMPTGNPRTLGIQTKGKLVAQRWGVDTGNPVSDSTYSAKRTMQTSLAGSGPSSIGGILSNGKSAFQHLANLGDKFVDLGNASGPNIPGGGYMGQAYNTVGNTIAPTPKTLGKLTAVRDNALKYGQESTKFYAGTGGGVHERSEALNSVGGGKTTAEEQASFLETEKQLMLERLAEKERQVGGVMGDNWLAAHPVRDAALQANLDKIDTHIATLRGEKSAAPASPAPQRTSTGVQWSIVGAQ